MLGLPPNPVDAAVVVLPNPKPDAVVLGVKLPREKPVVPVVQNTLTVKD